MIQNVKMNYSIKDYKIFYKNNRIEHLPSKFETQINKIASRQWFYQIFRYFKLLSANGQNFLINSLIGLTLSISFNEFCLIRSYIKSWSELVGLDKKFNKFNAF